MPRANPLARAALMGLLLIATAGSLEIASVTAHASQDVVDDPPSSEGPSWGAILGACFGVLFGGALALWQIRGMKQRR
ncbi:hypothetical protein [Paraliomyxa miuraensis]|uniref:hypothetical protein n=1 Tax=Paraliomyxa miuraensis TaxID=376150 RepID=UPI0022550834|nr:hypothetical protein [Paraliomyxa miuraensis]MCX4244817.1 hypothetical protein [Paraliomyxa miuraensis]